MAMHMEAPVALLGKGRNQSIGSKSRIANLKRHRATAACFVLAAFGFAETAHAYVITITSGSRAIYLQVGAGGYSGFYTSGGTDVTP